MTGRKNWVETDVLVVGAGPSGGAAGLLLSTYGIDNIVLNKYGGVSLTPRAHITNQRAVEIFRDMGIEGQTKSVATPQALMGEHVYATSLSGRELGRLKTWYTHPHWKAEHDLASPCEICDLPQDLLEPILLNEARNRGGKVRFNTEFLTFVQDDQGVTATVRDRLTGAEHEIRAKYMIGADGGRSTIVEQLGLPLEGKSALGGSINVVFQADLSRYVAHRPGDMTWMFQPGAGLSGNGVGVLRMVRPWYKWVGVWGFDISKGAPDLSNEMGMKIIEQLVGEPVPDAEIVSMSTWVVNDVHATDNMKGRVLCVGDAVHRHPPMNGLGSNTSIQDSYNICWKLAMVLRGEAGPALLESYRDERVPVGRQIVKRANKSMGLLPPVLQQLGLSHAPDAKDMARAIEALGDSTTEAYDRRKAFRAALSATSMGFNTLGVELNQNYVSCAVVPDGSSEPDYGLDEELYYIRSTRPGRHLPHVWVVKNQRKYSTLDLCGKGRFTLLTGPVGADYWRDRVAVIARMRKLPIDVKTIGFGCDYDDSYGDWEAINEVGEAGAILVRPDMIVAWRTAAMGDEASAGFESALSHILDWNGVNEAYTPKEVACHP